MFVGGDAKLKMPVSQGGRQNGGAAEHGRGADGIAGMQAGLAASQCRGGVVGHQLNGAVEMGYGKAGPAMTGKDGSKCQMSRAIIGISRDQLTQRCRCLINPARP